VASSFSAPGPTADGRFAPDVSAPGEFIIAALSSATDPSKESSAFFVSGMPHYAIADDGLHGVLRGTSQATPMVTGAAALLFQSNPALTPPRMRELLRACARDTGAGFSPREGFGHLDLDLAARFATGARGGAVSPSLSSVGVSRDALAPGDDTTTVSVTPRDDTGLPLGAGHTVSVAISAGALVGGVVDLGEGRYEQVVRATAKRGQVGEVSASVDGVALAAHPSVWFVLDRSEIGSPFSARGGCGNHSRPSGVLPIIMLLALANSRRRRGSTTLRG
jgi:subtilisin family serine protease